MILRGQALVQENNFKQPGDRYRSFDPARKERFVKRLAEVVGDARCTKVTSLIPHTSKRSHPSMQSRLL